MIAVDLNVFREILTELQKMYNVGFRLVTTLPVTMSYFCQSVIMDLASYSRIDPFHLIRTRASIIHHWLFQSFLTSVPATVSGDMIIYEANCVGVPMVSE